MAINETLKFSWGHIVAFCALIFISYVSFMGITYLEDGNFVIAAIGVIIIDAFLCLFFIGPQLLKGTDHRFSKRIVWERILFFVSPFFFVVLMLPYSHFWTVFDQRKSVEKTFSSAIEISKDMFVSYEKYSKDRLNNYQEKLVSIKSDMDLIPLKVDALKLQLLDKNYDTLKVSAYEWIDRASETTVWNVFMIGNIDKIEKAIDSWNASLNTFSTKIMTDEFANIISFSSADPSAKNSKDNLNTIREVYTTTKKPSLIALITALFLYFMMLFPYVVQRRNTKSNYRLLGVKNTTNKDDNRENNSGGKPTYKSFTIE